jgi:hypothetical protein
VQVALSPGIPCVAARVVITEGVVTDNTVIVTEGVVTEGFASRCRWLYHHVFQVSLHVLLAT